MRFGRFREIYDFGHIGEVIARECDDLGPPASQHAKIRAMGFDLQIDKPHLVSAPPQRLRDEFQPEGLKPQKNLCVHQRSRVDAKHPQGDPPFD